MDLWTFIFLITLASLAIPLSKQWFDHRARVMSMGETDSSVAGELESLKARVAVLEEIVTDKRYQLRRELDSLNE